MDTTTAALVQQLLRECFGDLRISFTQYGHFIDGLASLSALFCKTRATFKAREQAQDHRGSSAFLAFLMFPPKSTFRFFP